MAAKQPGILIKDLFQRSIKYDTIILLILAALIRSAGIRSRSIWYDEAFSILISENNPTAILAATFADVHPPGYYFILWTWMKLFGNTILSVRSLSILASLGIILVSYHLALKMIDRRTAFTGCLLVVLLPFQVHFSQEIRMYIFTTLFLINAVMAYWQAKESGAWRWWILFSFSAAGALYTHNLSIFFLIPLAVSPLLFKEWKVFFRMCLAGTLVTILTLPWLLRLPVQLASIQHAYWIQKPGIERLFTLLLLYLPNLPVPEIFLFPFLFFSLMVISFAFYRTFKTNTIPDRQLGWWLFYLAFGPPLFLWTVSQFWPFYLERIFLSSHVFFCLWLGWVISRKIFPSLIMGVMSIVLVGAAILGFMVHLDTSHFPYAPYEEMDNYLQDNLQHGDLILHSNKLSLLPAIYQMRNLKQAFVEDPSGSPTDTLAPTSQQVIGLTAFPDIRTAVLDADRVWLVIFQQSIDEFTQAGYPTHAHLQFLDEHFSLVELTEWDDLLVFLYSRK